MAGFFGGASNEQKWLGMQSMGTASQMQGWANDAYKNNQAALQQMQGWGSRIASGQTGMGFGMTENGLLQSQIVNSGAAAARNAKQESMDARAGIGGGGNTLDRGGAISSALNAGIDSRATTNTSNALNQETLANIQQGRTNAKDAFSEYGDLAKLYDPLGYAGASSTAHNTAMGEETQLSNLDTARSQAIGKLVEQGVGMAAGGFAGGLGAGGGLMDTLKGVGGGMMGDGGMFLQNPSGGGGGGYGPGTGLGGGVEFS